MFVADIKLTYNFFCIFYALSVADLKLIHNFSDRFHALSLFVEEIKLIQNFCGRFHDLSLFCGRYKAHSKLLWPISCIKIMFVADKKLS